MLNSLLMAFSLYSRIPVPQAQWNDKSMRYCICFLPLVGAVIGAVQWGMYLVLARLGTGAVLRGAVLTALPILLSGGIHLDGFMDTCDAIHSYGSREKRLEILKDPHIGAFAVIGVLVWLLLDFGVWTEAASGAGTLSASGAGAASGLFSSSGSAGAAGAANATAAAAGAAFRSTDGNAGICVCLLCLTFVLSRALSAYAAVTFPKAKKDGMLVQETDPAVRGTGAAMLVTAAVTAAAMILLPLALAGTSSPGLQGIAGAAAEYASPGLQGIAGAAAEHAASGLQGVQSLQGRPGAWLYCLPGVCAAAAAAGTLLYYRRMAMKHFGGTTGDLAGWFTQTCELVTGGVMAAVFALTALL